MTFKELKKKVKAIPFIGVPYEKLIGSKKVKKIEMAKKAELQKNGFEILKKVDETFTKYGIDYILDFGSLLGLCRDGKFMDFDDDMDFGIVGDFSWDTVEKALKEINLTKCKEYTLSGELIEQTYKADNMYVDFFKHTKRDNKHCTYMLIKKKDYTYENENDYHVVGNTSFDFPNTKKMTVNGVTFSAPSDPEKYLASVYTDAWKIPDKEWHYWKSPSHFKVEDELGHSKCFEID